MKRESGWSPFDCVIKKENGIALEWGHFEPSIIDKIRNSGDDLRVGMMQVGAALKLFTETGDAETTVKLFDAYKEWCTKNLKKTGAIVSDKVVTQTAMANLDSIARLMDNLTTSGGNSWLAYLVLGREEYEHVIGPVRSFYRQAVGYSPLQGYHSNN